MSCTDVSVMIVMVALACTITLTQSQSCSNPPPGMSKMVRGVDVGTLDMLPLDITSSSSGYKNPVLMYTCSQKREWVNPKGKKYQLPDQVWHVTTEPSGWSSTSTYMYRTGQDIKESLKAKAGLDGTVGKFSFSASYSYKKMQHTIHNTSKFIEDVSAFESSTRIDLNPQWALELDSYALTYLNTRVSGSFEYNRDAYFNFVKEFGTHYFSSANFGGFIRSYMETNKDYVLSKGDHEVAANAKASFLKVIKAHGGVTVGSTTVSTEFLEATTKSIKYYGGNTNILSSKGIADWQGTVDDDPWLFSGKLKPIYDLIPDPKKRSNMMKAVNEYIMRIYLNDLESVLLALQARLHFDPAIQALLVRVVAMKQLSILIESDLESLGNDVNAQVEIPRWFADSTRLCYRWRPDGDGGQCGGGARTELCAKPNTMTDVYRDDSDGRPGGCRMQWAIKSNVYAQPGWFNNVKICYRWHGDGNWGQCGGGAPRQICMPINSYTSEYRDDTDNRAGGCQMSWRIYVPPTSPAWMKTTKFCFRWYPDGDGGQCTAHSRNLCAQANTWTDYYRDDTDGRPGGCRMSWGLVSGEIGGVTSTLPSNFGTDLRIHKPDGKLIDLTPDDSGGSNTGSGTGSSTGGTGSTGSTGGSGGSLPGVDVIGKLENSGPIMQ